jgi:hypothetical protein
VDCGLVATQNGFLRTLIFAVVAFHHFTLILRFLRGQCTLKTLRLGDSCGELFNDTEFTQLFANNVLLSPSKAIKSLFLTNCGVSLEKSTIDGSVSQEYYHC